MLSIQSYYLKKHIQNIRFFSNVARWLSVNVSFVMISRAFQRVLLVNVFLNVFIEGLRGAGICTSHWKYFSGVSPLCTEGKKLSRYAEAW